MHYFQANPGGTGLEVPANNIVWCFIALIIGSFCYKVISAQQIKISKLFIVLLVTVVLMNIPYLYPTDWFSKINLTSESASRGICLLVGLFLFLGFQQIEKSTSTIARLTIFIVLAACIESFIILIQFYILTENNWLHFNVGSRPYGIFQQVNVASTFMAIGVILPIYSLLHQSSSGTLNKWRFTIFLLSTFICSWSIALIQSRCGYLALAATIIFGYCGSYTYYNKAKKLRNIWAFLILLGILFGSLSLHQSTGGGRSLENIKSVSARENIYSRSIEMFSEKPLIGWGYGNFEWAYLNYQAKDFEKDSTIVVSPTGLEHPHNELLYWAVEGGIAPIFGILIFTIYFLFQLKKSNEKLLLLGLLAPLAIHCMVELPFYHATIHWILFIFFIWLADNSEKYTLPVNYTFALRLLTPILTTITIIFMLTNLHTIYTLRQFIKTGNTRELSHIINPIGISDTLTGYNLALRYNDAINTENREDLNQYLIYLKDFVKYQPRPIFYKHYVMALLAIQQEEYAENIKVQNNYLFPKHRIHIEDGQIITESE
ncbi:MAG: Wzy polymerase domain-containing protein [Desulfotalea sp.]